jgi:hypothetical protein
VTVDASRAAWLQQARSHLRNADPVLARLIDDRPDFDPRAWMALLPSMDLYGALLFQITGQQLSVAATRRILARIELSDVTLRHAQLSNEDLSDRSWPRADLTGADLRAADLRAAVARVTRLEKAKALLVEGPRKEKVEAVAIVRGLDAAGAPRRSRLRKTLHRSCAAGRPRRRSRCSS